VLTGRFFGVGEFRALETIGLGVTEDGSLEFNQTKFQAVFENNPEGLRTFLSDETNGVVGKLTSAIERLAGEEDSLLAARSTALQDSIKANDDRLTLFTASLERQQERMELQFYQLESLVAKMQTSLAAIQNLQAVPPMTSARG
jgi:flagellar capping protein FliD